MSPMRIVRAVLPARVRGFLRKAQRDFTFRRAMSRFLADPEACARPGNPTLRALIYGWDNEFWSAQDEYLAECMQQALAASGPTLECGSGLSTVLLGTIAKRRGHAHWALEHTPEWGARVQKALARHGLDNVQLCVRPLRDYGDFTWYDPPLEKMPASFSLVICDGPPGSTKGGRYGLVPVMRQRLPVGTVLMIDDAQREEECAIAHRWQSEIGGTLEKCGTAKPYIKMTV